jgi:hypothetical protein
MPFEALKPVLVLGSTNEIGRVEKKPMPFEGLRFTRGELREKERAPASAGALSVEGLRYWVLS